MSAKSAKCTRRKVLGISSMLSVVLAVLACTPNGDSIFFTIEQEIKTLDSNLENDITVIDIVISAG